MAGTDRRTARSVRNFASIRVFRGLSRRVIFSARESHELHETRRSYSCRFVVKNDLLAVSYAGLRFAVKFGLHAQREFCFATDGHGSTRMVSRVARRSQPLLNLCLKFVRLAPLSPLPVAALPS